MNECVVSTSYLEQFQSEGYQIFEMNSKYIQLETKNKHHRSKFKFICNQMKQGGLPCEYIHHEKRVMLNHVDCRVHTAKILPPTLKKST